MLELEVEINSGLAGDLATRIMALWPGLEVMPGENSVSFQLAVDDRLDDNLKRFEKALQALERARSLEPLIVHGRNLDDPDPGPEVIRVGRFIIRRPDSSVYARDDQIVLSLEPGPAFGTGGHPSTALALKAVDEYYTPRPGRPSRSGDRVLDAGTGSGILALAAARLGTGPIIAVDTAPDAVEAARANMALNGMEGRVDVSQMGADQVAGEFDLILANLVTSVLVKVLKKLVPLLAPDGTVILAGFADGQAPQVVKAVGRTGLTVSKSYSRAGWSGLMLTRT